MSVIISPFAGGIELDDLSDVDAPTPNDEDVLVWDAGLDEWVSGAGGGGGGGSALEVDDEGVMLDAGVESLDFVGHGVVATGVGPAITVTITGSQKGLLSARPAAGDADGMLYHATDVGLSYISDGSTWTTVTYDHGAALTGLGDDDHTQYVLRSIATTKGDLFGRDGTVVVRVPAGTNDLPLVADSSAATGLAYKAIPEASVAGLVTDLAAKLAIAANLADVASAPTSRYNINTPVLRNARLVATTDLSLTGAATIDGSAVATGELVLATAQTTASQNGPWTANTAGAWTRPNDYPGAGTVGPREIGVTEGAVFANTRWQLSTATVTIDTTTTVWALVGPLVSGWYPSLATWTYSSVDEHISVVTVNQNLTGIVIKGDRIMLDNNSLTQLFIVHDIAYGSTSTLTLYGGALPLQLGATTYTNGGGARTTIAVEALQYAIPSGATLKFPNAQTVTVNGNHAVGATTLNINSATPSATNGGWIARSEPLCSHYVLANSAITKVFFSHQYSPVGFDPAAQLWTERIADTAARSIAAPGTSAWNNPGAFQLALPIGAWQTVGYGCTLYQVTVAADTAITSGQPSATLATANNSETESRMTRGFAVSITSSSQKWGLFGYASESKGYSVVAKTSLFLNVSAAVAPGANSSIQLLSGGTFGCHYISAKSAYV